MTKISDKAVDIEALALEEGITLPYPAEMIARLEETGAVVDLTTGTITLGGADQRYEVTPAGEAIANLIEQGLL
jgi:hypothetical protein